MNKLNKILLAVVILLFFVFVGVFVRYNINRFTDQLQTEKQIQNEKQIQLEGVIQKQQKKSGEADKKITELENRKPQQITKIEKVTEIQTVEVPVVKTDLSSIVDY